MPISGKASSEHTAGLAKSYRDFFPADAYRKLGKTELFASRLGFGTYRCHQNNRFHARALRQALKTGCNLIDTSANYGDGMAEKLIGEVIADQPLRREALILVSKVGYLQGENLLNAKRRESRGYPFPEMVKYHEDIWHCIHPDFIRDQLEKSRDRLGVQTIDVYLLHNPEYFLIDALKRGRTDARAVFEEFYRRIGQAFRALEELADSGKIQYYGISSNTLPGDPGRRDFVSLTRIWEEYRQVCRESGKTEKEGRFAIIQLPYNWLENEAFTLKNNKYRGKNYTVLELAQKLRLAVLVNRPLNAIRNNRLHRLARYPFRADKDYPAEISERLDELKTFENTILKMIKEWNMDVPVQQKARLSEFFGNAEKMREILGKIEEESQLDLMLAQYFVPMLQIAGEHFARNLPPEHRDQGQAAIQGLFNLFNRLTRLMREYLHARNYKQVSHLENLFNSVYPELSDKLSFSQKSLLLAVSTPGVDVVLNGMRTPEYVKDSMAVMEMQTVAVERLIPGSKL